MPGRTPILKEDEARFLAALKDFPVRDQTLVILGLNTGFRITELLSLTIGQVFGGDGIKSQVRIERARLKGGRGARKRAVSSRAVPLNTAATQAIEALLFARFGSGVPSPLLPLFEGRHKHQPLSRWQANRIVHAVVARAGLGSPEQFGTHSLRKSFCLRIYQATGHDINLTRAVMGHCHVTTTQKYLHVDETQMTAAVLAIGSTPAIQAETKKRAVNT